MNKPDATPRRDARKISLSKYSYHTGGTVRPLESGEGCPLLFRDVGLEAMERFLSGSLRKLCGPYSPITYLRSASYQEPYVDFGRIGRILVLQPETVVPWHSGIDHVYIAPREIIVDPQRMVFLPSDLPMSEAAIRFRELSSVQEYVEVVGRREYALWQGETQERIVGLIKSHCEAEVAAAPLRRRFQSAEQSKRDEAREEMESLGLTESDLCTAWHHLSDDRRDRISDALQRVTRGVNP